jgi:hypothetical protein
MSTRVRIPLRTLLGFYDDPDKSLSRHISSITGVLGEDLGAGLIVDHFEQQGLKVKVLDRSVTPGTNKGHRLDRWICVEHPSQPTIYQVEIKNWGALAIGGRRLKIDAEESVLRAHRLERWSKEWDGKTFRKDSVRKVLIPMRSPIANMRVEPMVCFWDAMHPAGAADPLFKVNVPTGRTFPYVWVFSMSSYVRKLLEGGREEIVIEAKATSLRFELLGQIIGKVS